MSIKNKVVGSFAVIIAISLFSSIFVSYNIKNIRENVDKLSNEDFAGVTVLLEADRDSYQSNLALLQIMSLDDKEKIAKTIDKGVKNNLQQVRDRFNKFKTYMNKHEKGEKSKFDDFEKFYSQTEINTNKLISLVNNEQVDEAKAYYFGTYLGAYESMRDIMDFFTTETYKVIDVNQKNTSTLINVSLSTFIIIALLSVMITIIFTFLLGRTINKGLSSFENGLLGFFSYLNRESDTVELLDDSSGDEIAKMAKVVNENINKTRSLLDQDNALIEEVKVIVSKVKDGHIKQTIKLTTQNKSLEELKIIFNEMLVEISNNVCEDINKLQKALDEYKKLNFTYKLGNLEGNTAKGLDSLAQTITHMLVENKTNGIILQNSAHELLSSVDILNQSSSQTSASLEETAAALEEITATISTNASKIKEMTDYADKVTHAVEKGEQLAVQTTQAMDNLNSEVSSINEAISVIDQIAFQTNILSLNAAVEAATAGEAGKGFAVVAQEVRNLASRSAEAAKEIKDLVTNAIGKATNGKEIADNMIKGYLYLNENIHKTIELINSVSESANEQRSGIEQINSAVNNLDREMQKNASVSDTTKDIAMQTQAIADSIVAVTDEKEFDGKHDIKVDSKVSKTNFTKSTSQQINKDTKQLENKKEESAKVVKKPLQNIVASKTNDGDWESF